MAAGVPVVVSDWDGYRYTVSDGVEGFLVPLWLLQVLSREWSWPCNMTMGYLLIRTMSAR